MEGFGVTLITSKAQTLLVTIVILSLLAILWHVWLTRRMSFLNFKEDKGESARLKGRLRLLIPFGVLVVWCLLLPFVFILSSSDLEYYIGDPESTWFVLFPWNLVLPARDWVLTLLFDVFLGTFFYWVAGLALWYTTLRMRKRSIRGQTHE